MSESNLVDVREMLKKCSTEEQQALFLELSQRHQIHEFERIIGAPAEMILEAVHRAPELTRRMLRGVIADAAFRTFVVPVVQTQGWRDVTPEGNFAYDYLMEDALGQVSVQVKLQRSAKGAPVIKSGLKYGFGAEVFTTETQKTRTGKDGDEQTRPYRYDEFDILAVSMQPSTARWDRYLYIPGRWLLAGKKPDEMATIQPVAKEPNDYWTDDFATAAAWFRTDDRSRRISLIEPSKPKKIARDSRKASSTGKLL